MKRLKLVVYRFPTLVSAVVWVGLPIIAGLLLGGSLEEIFRRPQYTGVAVVIGATISAIAYFHRVPLVNALPSMPHRAWNLEWQWLIVIAAVGLRYVFLGVVPPEFPGFEEMQQGKIANDIVNVGAHLPFHFLFSNSLAAMGLWLRGNEIDDLRWAYEIAGAVSIVLMAMSLRTLGVRWSGTLAAVFIMASLRWAVIVGGLAEETFGPMMLLTGMLLTLVLSEKSTTTRNFWAAICGVICGMLMYEYTAYLFFVPLPAGYWLICALVAKGPSARRSALVKGAWFIVAFTAIAAPMVGQLITEPEITHAGDALLRHNIYETKFQNGATGAMQTFLRDGVSYFGLIFGVASDQASAYFRPANDSVIPWIVGVVFAAGILNALLRPKDLLPFVLAISAIGFVVIIAATSNTYYEARMTPLLPLLVVLSGLMFERCVASGSEQRATRFLNVNAVAVIFVMAVVWINYNGAVRLSEDETAVGEYARSTYAVCEPISEQPYVFRNVLGVTEFDCEFGDEIWLYPDLEFEWDRVDGIPNAADIQPSTLVVVGGSLGLPEDLKEGAEALAQELGDEETLLGFKTMFDRIATVTFCHRCEVDPG